MGWVLAEWGDAKSKPSRMAPSGHAAPTLAARSLPAEGARSAFGRPGGAVKRLLQAPNLALATLWADQLTGAGIGASVQRAYASGIAGHLPPDQCLPEVWVDDAGDHDRAQALLHEWRRLPHRTWACPGCHEIVEGPFEQCWNCGRPMGGGFAAG
jgi:hypothetical protein